MSACLFQSSRSLGRTGPLPDTPMRLRSLSLLVAVLMAVPAAAQLRTDWTLDLTPTPDWGGRFSHVATGADGAVYAAGYESQSLYVARAFPNGTLAWLVNVMPADALHFSVSGLVPLSDGGVVVVGRPEVYQPTVVTDIGAIGLGPDGAIRWVLRRNGPAAPAPHLDAADVAIAARPAPDDDLYVLAHSHWSEVVGGSYSWLLRVDGTTGAVEWERSFLTPVEASRPVALATDCAGNAYLSAQEKGTFGGSHRSNGHLGVYSPEGALMRTHNLAMHATAHVEFEALAVACDGTAYVTGTRQLAAETLGARFVARFDPSGGPAPAWTVYPFDRPVRPVDQEHPPLLTIDFLGRPVVAGRLVNSPYTLEAVALLETSGAVRWQHERQGVSFDVNVDALAATPDWVYLAGHRGESDMVTAWATETGVLRGETPLPETGGGRRVAATAVAVDAAGGLLVGKGWRLVRITTAGSQSMAQTSGSVLSLNVETPARGTATVRFSLRETSDVRLAIVDALGREQAVSAGVRNSGAHRLTLSVGHLPPGAYSLRLHADGQTVSRRLTVVR